VRKQPVIARLDDDQVRSGCIGCSRRALRLQDMILSGERCAYAISAVRPMDYQAVPAKLFKDLLVAESKGRFVNWSIKPYYRYRRVN
jgi:hypothetical protein